MKAFSLNVDADAKDLSEAQSVEEILELVALEAGEEAAEVLAKMFSIDRPAIELKAQAEPEPIESREERIRQLEGDRRRWGGK